METITEGLDSLSTRLEGYRALGIRFAKWQAVIAIGKELPTPYCLYVNAHALARYAATAREAGLVPIVEPEVLMTGFHSLERCFEVTEAALRNVFQEPDTQRVSLEGMLLKPNMVVSGTDAPARPGSAEVAKVTIRCFRRVVSAVVPGIAFLSGGQGDDEATANLNAINIDGTQLPWKMIFSYGRGLQSTPMAIWSGNPENVARAQEAFLKWARVTAAAREGTYSGEASRTTG